MNSVGFNVGTIPTADTKWDDSNVYIYASVSHMLNSTLWIYSFGCTLSNACVAPEI